MALEDLTVHWEREKRRVGKRVKKRKREDIKRRKEKKREGKWKKEDQHWNCKLNREIVRAIRADYETGLYSYSGIMEKYGLVSVSHVASIITKRIWKNV